jgi:hypothetical protein
MVLEIREATESQPETAETKEAQNNQEGFKESGRVLQSC